MKVALEEVDVSLLKIKKPKKSKAPKEPRDVRYVFRKHLGTVDIEALKKPWMATKAFRIITNQKELWEWAENVIADKGRHKEVFGQITPVVACDTETVGLDTRILVDILRKEDGSWELVYEVKIEIAGVCLSSDGVEGIYVPINHEDGHNMDRAACAEVLQWLFDQVHIVFYNAKFDREVLRLCLGLSLRPYPYFEDVQVIQYLNDPKADLDEARGGAKKKYSQGDSTNLKAMSKNVLGMDQIELESLAKIKADYCPLADSAYKCGCTAENNKKHTQRVVYVPFTWVPTDLALWYAASDAICTWLLWEKESQKARERKVIHKIDHEMVESLTWIERQRFLIAVSKYQRTVAWHHRKLEQFVAELRKLALEAGYVERKQADGSVLPEDQFNPNSTGVNGQLPQLLFKVMGLKVVKLTGAGNASADAEVIEELRKLYPDNKFLKVFEKYKSYVTLHPENLRYDSKDNSARIFLKQNVVAGGRLAAAGGDFPVDGGFGLNPQGIKRVESHLMWKVQGNVLEPDSIPVEDIQAYPETMLHHSCFREIEIEKDGKREKVRRQAPGIINNHIGQYMGYAICLVPTCTSCAEKYGILISNGRMDANEVVNLRMLFTAPDGWTFLSIDYSNIEMRAAANISREPEFVKEFLEGEGDFHALTASKVFPEFNDPNTPKDVKKKLRSLAKIINFALLYGGTEYTIFENMKTEKPDITWDEAKKMVADYWAGVPVFADFCNTKQHIARSQMICTTATGRVINFKTAMESLGVRQPTKEEWNNYFEYRRLVKAFEAAKKEGNKELADKLKAQYDRLWKDPETGVRNCKEYNSFIGKIQRVSVNVPLQGLAGDFMRMSLNRIRRWVLSDPLIQTVLRLHSSVHDEIDLAVKNEYLPFVVPRLTRLMKLRKLHAQMKWPVPIECDTEYGRSWDVDHHLTGDKDHKAAAWVEVEGMQNYLPNYFELETIKQLLSALCSSEERRVSRAIDWLKEQLHPRAFETLKDLNKYKERKDIKKRLLAALQLDEYWKIDGMPDEDENKLETLEQFEKRNGLTVADRGIMPEFGFLGAVPLTANVNRPTLEILGAQIPAEQVEIVVSSTEIRAEAPVSTACTDCHPDHECPGPKENPVEDDVLYTSVSHSVEKPVEVKTSELVAAPPIGDGIPELADLSDQTSIDRLNKALGLGKNKIAFRYQGQVIEVADVAVTSLPKEFTR